MTAQILLFSILIILVLFRNRVPYWFRAGFIVAGTLLLGLGGLWQIGLVGSASVWLAASPALAAMFFGTGSGIVVLVFTIASSGVIGIFTVFGYRLPPFDPSVYAVQASSWVSMIVGLSLVAATLVAALIMYNRHLIAALQEANHDGDELARRVEERAAELKAAQATLLRQERLAALGQLTGTVAHEIRNPLGAIANTFSVIKHRCVEAGLEVEPALARADRNIKRCDRIITELLDFARARGIQCESVPLDSWLSDVVKEQQIPEGIRVGLEFQTDNSLVEFDPHELRRAAINVIDNACQAMVNGRAEDEAVLGELTIKSRLADERVEIEFADTGPGIPEDVLPQVLEPLYSTRSFGTGLGLPIALRIMEQHGGGLVIDNREDGGTRVVLWLPRQQAGAEAPR